MVVRLIQHPEITQAACKLAKRLELSGFHGLDFMLEPKSGAAYLIELNPRCTQLGHLPIADHGDLAGLFCKKLGIVSPRPPDQTPPMGLSPGETVAFFPNAFLWNSKSRYWCDSYQDTPWKEPALMRELLKRSWPDRQWRARLYHWVRPPRQEKPEVFEGTPSSADVRAAQISE